MSDAVLDRDRAGPTNEAIVQAAGYYPAIVEFMYENLLASKGRKTTATLVVPMVRRPVAEEHVPLVEQ